MIAPDRADTRQFTSYFGLIWRAWRSTYHQQVHELLRSVWDEPAPPHPPARVWRDWALVGVLVPLAVVEGVLRPDLPWRVLSVAIVLAVVPTLLWRRTRPLLMVAVAF